MNRNEGAPQDLLGPFEQQLLIAIMRLGGEAYGTPIQDKTEEIAMKRINQGSMYLTLDRLVEKGFITARYSDPNEEKGRPKRYFRLTPQGMTALKHSTENALRLAELYQESQGSVQRWLTKMAKRLAHQNS